jgi:hypothetical protein
MELENALKAVESENAISKTRIDSLQKTATEQETQLKEQNKKTEELSQYNKVNDRLEYLYPKRVDMMVLG